MITEIAVEKIIVLAISAVDFLYIVAKMNALIPGAIAAVIRALLSSC